MGYFKKYKFDKSKFKLGMRTFKTGVAVFLVLLVFGLFGWKGLQIGALTAVFSLREDFDKSVHFGTSRILGNSIGGLYALLFFLINNLFHEQFLGDLTGRSYLYDVNDYDKCCYEQQSGSDWWCFCHADYYFIYSNRRDSFVCICTCL